MHHHQNRCTTHSQKGNAERRPLLSDETAAASILHKLDLGSHLLFLMSDGSINLLTRDKHTPSLVDNGMHFDRDETYRLFISLHEQFKLGW